MSDESRTPTLTDLFLRMARSTAAGSVHCLPATVIRYDATRQCVDAQPTIMSERAGEDDTTIVKLLPPVLNAPVMFYGSGSYRHTIPVEVGAVVMLHFTSASMERWLTLGGQVEPRDGRRHTLSDAVAYLGGHSFAGTTAPATTAPINARVLHGQLTLIGDDDANDPVVRKSDLDQVVARLEGHGHPGFGAPPTPDVPPFTTPACSTRLKLP